MEMPKSNKKAMNIRETRTMSFPCGKEAVQGPIQRMKLMSKLHAKTCDICSSADNINIGGGNTNLTNGISGLNVSFTKLNEYTSEI